MTHRRRNPFEEYDLDPRDGLHAITERFRELAEDAGEAERQEIRAAWEELTLHPLRRIRAACSAHPSYPEPPGSPPPPAPEPAPAAPKLTLRDLALLPSVTQALGPIRRAAPPPPISLDDDPILKRAPH